MSKDTARRIVIYWQMRRSTAEIADRLSLTEAEVYNFLAGRRA